MNILYVAPDIPIPHTGSFVGGSTHVMKVAESLIKKGNRVYVLSRRESKQVNYEEINDNFFTRRIYRGLLFPVSGGIQSDNQKISTLWALMERCYFLIYRAVLVIFTIYLLRKYKIDAIIDRGSSKGVGVFSGFILGIPTVVELIDPDYSKISLRFTKTVLAYTTKVVPSNFHDKVEIVNAGVDTNLFSPVNGSRIREKYDLQNKKIVVYVGSLSEWHGVKDLIDIAALIDEDVHFLLIGKNLKELEKKATEKNVISKFSFTGFVNHNEVPEYISAGDIAIAPFNPNKFSKMDKYGFYFSPVKIFEYMACGKPVVASNVDIVRQIVQDNECGLLAEPGDPISFVNQIKRLMDDKRLKERLGENGRHKVCEKYAWEKVAEKILASLEK